MVPGDTIASKDDTKNRDRSQVLIYLHLQEDKFQEAQKNLSDEEIRKLFADYLERYNKVDEAFKSGSPFRVQVTLSNVCDSDGGYYPRVCIYTLSSWTIEREDGTTTDYVSDGTFAVDIQSYILSAMTILNAVLKSREENA